MANQKIALVIDDEPDVVGLVKDILKGELGYLVLSATDAEVAVEMAESYLFDLLVLDLHMPKLDGFEVLARVRKKQPDVKVIVITGLLDEYAAQLKEANIDLVLEKPLEFPAFQESVAKIAGEASAPPKPSGVPKAKILLVDDEVEQSIALKEFLLDDTPNEYEIEIAERAEDGLRLNSDWEPDLILTDIKMPNLRGDDMVQVINRQPGHKPKQIVVITAVSNFDILQKMKEAGCEYLSKPFRVEEVLELVRTKCSEFTLIKK